jgi:hypothetical protein
VDGVPTREEKKHFCFCRGVAKCTGMAKAKDTKSMKGRINKKDKGRII